LEEDEQSKCLILRGGRWPASFFQRGKGRDGDSMGGGENKKKDLGGKEKGKKNSKLPYRRGGKKKKNFLPHAGTGHRE